jgi:hypothetical protein
MLGLSSWYLRVGLIGCISIQNGAGRTPYTTAPVFLKRGASPISRQPLPVIVQRSSKHGGFSAYLLMLEGL